MNTKISTLLNVDRLSISFGSGDETFEAVHQISFSLEKGNCLGIVGESGSGKSVSSLSLMGLLQGNARVKAEDVWMAMDGEKRSLLNIEKDQWPELRGRRIAMVFQEPMTSLNPVMTCGKQITEALVKHFKLSGTEAKAKTIDLFEEVKLPDPERAFNSYPHQLSGGQRQRVVIAMALSCDPELLIADEPTTALDVTVQHSILELLRRLMEERSMGMIFITHDLAVVANIANEIIVMRSGKILEQGELEKVLSQPKHPYTKGLLECRPQIGKKRYRLPTVAEFMESKDHKALLSSKRYRLLSAEENENRMRTVSESKTLLEVAQLSVHFNNGKSVVKAVNEVSFKLKKGEVLGLVGESGCGKSTLSRALLGLLPVHSGDVFYRGEKIVSKNTTPPMEFRKKAQLIFQDPMSSLNPNLNVLQTISEPMKVHGIALKRKERVERAADLLEKVGLDGKALAKYPHEFSGGQRQRIVIARALAVEPEFLICDESVAALDVSVQAQVLNLLSDLKDELQLSYIFITHDLSVVNHISDHILVMNKGKVEEYGWAEEIVQQPKSSYTSRLIKSIPDFNQNIEPSTH